MLLVRNIYGFFGQGIPIGLCRIFMFPEIHNSIEHSFLDIGIIPPCNIIVQSCRIVKVFVEIQQTRLQLAQGKRLLSWLFETPRDTQKKHDNIYHTI